MSTISMQQDEQSPVPILWRTDLAKLVNTFIFNERLELEELIIEKPLSQDILEISRSNILDYPDDIGPLDDKSWNSSICIWTGNYWDVLVDISTLDGETSDLVMHVKIIPNEKGFSIDPGLIYVP